MALTSTGRASVAASVTRLAGATRVATAIAVSQNSFPVGGSAGAVVLASETSFADADAATPLAVAKHAPLLLTPPGTLDPALLVEVQRVLTAGGTIYLVGGTAAISDNVAAPLSALGFNVVRLAGTDRFATATVVAGALPTVAKLLEATGLDSPDALAAGAAAAAGGGAVVLTNGTAMPATTARYIAQHSGVPRFAVGGAAAGADPAATPLVGADRFATAVLVARTFFPTPRIVGVASGQDFPDALAGGAHIGAFSGPLLLTDPSTLSPSTAGYLSANVSTVKAAYLYGARQQCPTG